VSDVWPLFYRSLVWQYTPDKAARLAALEDAVAGNRVPMLVEEKPTIGREGLPALLNNDARLESIWDGGLGYRVFIHADHPCLIGSSIAWYDEWRAVDQDGRPLKVLRVNHAFLGVEIPSGTQEARFYFEARYHRLGLWISLIALGMYLGIGIGCRKRWKSTVEFKNRFQS